MHLTIHYEYFATLSIPVLREWTIDNKNDFDQKIVNL